MQFLCQLYIVEIANYILWTGIFKNPESEKAHITFSGFAMKLPLYL